MVAPVPSASAGWQAAGMVLTRPGAEGPTVEDKNLALDPKLSELWYTICCGNAGFTLSTVGLKAEGVGFLGCEMRVGFDVRVGLDGCM